MDTESGYSEFHI